MVIVRNRLALEVEAGRDILIDYWLNTDTNRQGWVKEYSEVLNQKAGEEIKSSRSCDFSYWKSNFLVKWSFERFWWFSVLLEQLHHKQAHKCIHFRVGRGLCFPDEVQRTREVQLISQSTNSLEKGWARTRLLNPVQWTFLNYVGYKKFQNQGSLYLDFSVWPTISGQFSKKRIYPFCTQFLPAHFQSICIWTV